MNKNTKALAVSGSYELADTNSMAKMATVLKDHIIKHNLYTPIMGKNYVNVEGWQYAGGLLGSFPRIKAVTNLSTANEVKWQAEVEIVNSQTGAVVSTGFAVCSNKETKKKSFDEYAVLSMAQTRAIGKAYRNVIGWVIKLAGYESTPKEEAVNVAGDAITPKVVIGENEKGLQDELPEIQKALTDLGYTTPTKQLSAIKAWCKRENVEFDGWRMTKSQAKGLLAALLKKKHEDN